MKMGIILQKIHRFKSLSFAWSTKDGNSYWSHKQTNILRYSKLQVAIKQRKLDW